MRRPIEERFFEKVARTPDGCWEWVAAKSIGGYGLFYFDGRQGYAHRFAYTHFTDRHLAPWPEGVIDHLCRNRPCVNPDHLEAVTQQENLLRGVTIPARNAAKTHCDNGHEYTPESTYYYANGNRRCRPCNAEQAAARRVRVG